MSNLAEKIDQDIKIALKAHDTIRRSVLAMLKAALMNRAIAKRKKEEGLNKEEEVQVLSQEIKKIKEEMSFLETNLELKKQRQEELEILENYMPEQMSDDQIRKVVLEIIKGGADNIGVVMQQAMVKLKGKADGAKVKKIAESEL